jgi:dipeptidyl aminopeptidase/acylaminoacyl peptidase
MALAARGYAVCALEYRHPVPPDIGWPGTFDDIAAGLDTVPYVLRDLIDTDRLVVLGHSAGGHLALWASARHRQPHGSRWRRAEPAPITGVVSLAGICDLERAWQLRLGSDAVGSLLGGAPDVRPEQYAVTDPMRLVPTGVRTVVMHGDSDDSVPVEVSRAYATAARASGDETDLRVLAGADHFDLIDPLSTAWPHVLEALVDVLRPHGMRGCAYDGSVA